VAAIPPDIDMHLLAHGVGDILYRQQGLGGIKVCTHDFRNACSHSIVIGLFVERGEAALPEIAQACYQAPGGSGAYTMCFHGLGHGILAYTGYKLEEAIEICKKTGTESYNYEESAQCISGSIMEIINGVHDRALWERQHVKYFKQEDLLYPCSGELIPEHAKVLCYLYLTPHLFDVAGNMFHPTPEVIGRAFQLCNRLPQSDFANRDACYGGFGKEFIGLVQERDIRLSAAERITDTQLSQIYEWCQLADTQEGTAACIVQAMNSLYWGGENPRSVSIRFCSVIPDPFYQRACFLNLMDNVAFYIKDQNYRAEFCKELPNLYQEECSGKLQ